MKHKRLIDFILMGAVIAAVVFFTATMTVQACEPFVVNSTAYANPAGNPTYSGKPTVEGRTLAGKKEWI